MEYRVYNIEKEGWVNKDVYLTPKGELFMIKQSLFGVVKIPLKLDTNKYVYHKSIGLFDKNNEEVFEGDYIKANVGKVDEDDENSEDKIEIGIVSYAHELSAYVILCVNSDTFYTLGSQVCDYIEVVGNVFDGYNKEV